MNDRTQLLESAPIPKAVAKLVIPSIAAQLVTILYNLADTYFVGMLNNADQSAAVSFASTVTLALLAATNLFGIGGSSFFGRCLGAKDHEKARNTSSFAIWAAIAFGLIYSLVYMSLHKFILNGLGASGESWNLTHEYLVYTIGIGAIPSIFNVVMAYMVRCEGRSMHASIGTMSGCILNIILDPFFVLPQFLGMGVGGAGLATCISNCVASVYFIVLILKDREKTNVELSPKKAIPTKEIVKEVFQVGIPCALQNVLNVTGMAILNNFTAAYGADAVAAAGIATKLFLIALYVNMAFGQGAMPLFSYNCGCKNYKRAKNSYLFTTMVATIVGILIACIYFFGAKAIMTGFIKKEEIITYGTGYLKNAAWGAPFLAIDFVGTSLCQAFGKGKLTLLYAVLRKIVLEIPAMIIFDKLMPYYGLGFSQPISVFVMSIIATAVTLSMFKKLEKANRVAEELEELE